ncbi:hypothetical protein Ddc_14597 [Ditylenchus destructor]|nr:hypothetical protein Ddc_14597 [Ditylenchus destructor]
MDNGTLVESFKFLNYFQLAKNSLASKRFRDVIRMHRHKLALLYVHRIDMSRWGLNKHIIQIFDKALSPKEYKEWTVRNQYSKQIPEGCQVAGMESTKDDRKFYRLTSCYKVSPNLKERHVFYAYAELNHENWPLFEHFIRLLTDPFIYIQSMELTARNDILHLLEKAMNPDRNRLQCDNLWLYLEGNAPKFISWIKDHVRCDRLHVFGYKDSNKLNYDNELLDLFMTGANCSSEVRVFFSHSFPEIVDDFVQKFLDLKEYQIVESITFYARRSIDELKKYSEFIVKNKLSSDGTTNYTFEFVNDNIGKKLELTTFKMKDDYGYDHLSCCVSNL